jgi:putative SOS response-associated peptidase YedK
MCGRFVRKVDLREAAEQFKATLESNIERSFNITPRQPMIVYLCFCKILPSDYHRRSIYRDREVVLGRMVGSAASSRGIPRLEAAA